MITMRPFFACALVAGMCFATPSASIGAEIRGHVLASDTNAPLAGANVGVYLNCTEIVVEVCNFSAQVVTDNTGAFDITNVDIGPGHLDFSFDYGSSSNYLSNSQTLTIAPDELLDSNFYMDPGAAISGKVTSSLDNSAVGGVALILLGASDGEEYDQTVSDAQGNYRFLRLRARSYVVRTGDAAPYQRQYFAGHALVPPSQGAQVQDAIPLVAGQVVDAVDFSLVLGGVIHGTLVNAYSGLPIANVSQVLVPIYDANDTSGYAWNGASSQVSTDAQGHYVLSGLPTVPIRFAAYIDSPYFNFTPAGCPVTPCDDIFQAAIFHPSTATPLTADLSLFPGTVATGTVTRRSDGQPLAGVTVQGFEFYLFLGHTQLATAVTDAQGHYTLTNMDPISSSFMVNTLAVRVGGVSYIDQVYNGHDCPQANCNGIGDQLTTPENVVAQGVDFVLDVGATISGTVIDKTSGNGVPAEIELYASDGTYSTQLGNNSDGTFRTTGIEPGTYYLLARPFAASNDCVIYPTATCDGSAVSTVGQPIVVSGTNDVSGIVIALPSEELFGNGFD